MFTMTTIKCNSCNIVIDELLSYVQNKISIMDEETLVRICTTSFTSDEIKNSKSLLFESVSTNKNKINRKNKGKEERDLYDIINLFKSTEPDVIPVFVARQLEKLPPILFDHLDCTKLLKDILKVQHDLNTIKSNYVTQKQLSDCKIELLQMKNDSLPPVSAHNVNLKRGAWLYDSGPMGLSHVNNSSLIELNDNIENKSVSELRDSTNNMRVDEKNDNVPSQLFPALDSSEIKRKGELKSMHTNRSRDVTSEGSDTCVGRPLSIVNNIDIATSNCVLNTDSTMIEANASEEWQTVSKKKRKLKYRYIGTSGISRDIEGNFKAADKKVPILITKVHKESSEKSIVDYVYRKSKETIRLEEISFKTDRDYKAFKFFVSEKKLSIFLDNKMWPEGVIFRRFINFGQKNTNSRNTVISEVQQ